MHSRALSLRVATVVILALSVAGSLSGCSVVDWVKAKLGLGRPREVYLSPAGFNADLVTHSGIHVKTNGQYKTDAARAAAAAAIDRYWREVRTCAENNIPETNRDTRVLLDEFPHHLSIEIADDWKIVTGPQSHRRVQAFRSIDQPGAFATARREESALYIKVVPELDGLSTQMAGEVNVFLTGHTSATAGDLASKCADVGCVRFDYDNSPSQAWESCTE